MQLRPLRVEETISVGIIQLSHVLDVCLAILRVGLPTYHQDRYDIESVSRRDTYHHLVKGLHGHHVERAFILLSSFWSGLWLHRHSVELGLLFNLETGEEVDVSEQHVVFLVKLEVDV